MMDRLYNCLVNRNQNIYQKYKVHRKGRKGIGIIGSWIYLLKLNLSELFFGKKDNHNQVKGHNVLFKETRESTEVKRDLVKDVAKRCEEFDVISFDVFDTLLFRGVCEPTDVFHFVGKKLKIPNLEQTRREAECRMYRLKKVKGQVGKVTLEDIWQLIEKETGIDGQRALQAELEVEREMCFANPYMLDLLKELVNRKKRIIAISDMYLGENQIRGLLSTSGIPDAFEAVFVSSEWGGSKYDGRLYHMVKEKVGKELSYFHIGDNEYADVKQARRHGFTPHHYPNVNDIGASYQTTTFSTLAESVYRGLINAHIHNGLKQYNKTYNMERISRVSGICKKELSAEIVNLESHANMLRKQFHENIKDAR